MILFCLTMLAVRKSTTIVLRSMVASAAAVVVLTFDLLLCSFSPLEPEVYLLFFFLHLWHFFPWHVRERGHFALLSSYINCLYFAPPRRWLFKQIFSPAQDTLCPNSGLTLGGHRHRRRGSLFKQGEKRVFYYLRSDPVTALVSPEPNNPGPQEFRR